MIQISKLGTTTSESMEEFFSLFWIGDFQSDQSIVMVCLIYITPFSVSLENISNYSN